MQSPNDLRVRFLRIVAPTEILLMDVRTTFKWYHRVLFFIPWFLDIENVVDVSEELDILISPISINLERPPFSLGCKLVLRRSLRQRNQAFWKERPKLWLRSCVCDAEDPCSVNNAYEPESSFTTSPRETTRLWNFFSNPNSPAKMKRISFFFCACSVTFCVLFIFNSRHAGKFFKLSHSSSTAAFCIWDVQCA